MKINRLKEFSREKLKILSFRRKLSLQAKESKQVKFTADQFKQLEISNPRLWWPHTLGVPNLYDLNLSFEISGKLSDSQETAIRNKGSGFMDE